MYPLRLPLSFLTYIFTFTLHTSVLVFSLFVLHILINLSYFALYFLFSPLFFFFLFLPSFFLKNCFSGLPWWLSDQVVKNDKVVKNALANVGDTGLIPDPGKFHMPYLLLSLLQPFALWLPWELQKTSYIFNMLF